MKYTDLHNAPQKINCLICGKEHAAKWKLATYCPKCNDLRKQTFGVKLTKATKQEVAKIVDYVKGNVNVFTMQKIHKTLNVILQC